MGQATDATSLRLFTTTQFNLLAETGMRNAEVRADELPSMNYPGLAGHGVNYPELPRSHVRRACLCVTCGSGAATRAQVGIPAGSQVRAIMTAKRRREMGLPER